MSTHPPAGEAATDGILIVRPSQTVRVDPHLHSSLKKYDWRLLGGRIVAVEENRFFDLLRTVAGAPGWTCDRLGDCRRSNLRPAVSKVVGSPPTAASPPTPQPFLAEPPTPLGAVDFVAWHARDQRCTVAVDSLATAGSVLVLSHWANLETPARWRRDVATESVFEYLEQDGVLPSRLVTTDHFDADGALATFALAQPETAWRHRHLLMEAARYGDFRRSDDPQAIKVAAVCEGIRRALGERMITPTNAASRRKLLAACLRAVLTELPAALRNMRTFRWLWEVECAHISATEAEINRGGIRLVEVDRTLDLAVWEVDRPYPGWARLPSSIPIYAGWSQAPFHARCGSLNLLILGGRQATIRQRYEGWARLESQPAGMRTDLVILGTILSTDSKIVVDDTAAAPWHLTPSLGLVVLQKHRRWAIKRLKQAWKCTPVGWHAHANRLLPVYGTSG